MFVWSLGLCFLSFFSFANMAMAGGETGYLNNAQELLAWMRDLPDAQTGMPQSYRPKTSDVYQDMGGEVSVTGIIERMIVRQGVSVYDAALWQMALLSTDTQSDLQIAARPTEVYWTGKLGAADSIRTGYDGQPFVYNPDEPGAVSANISAVNHRGFVFRILDSRGRYLSDDPLDGKEQVEGFPNSSAIHWEDWRPIAGENAWVVMAALHLYQKKYKGMTEPVHDAAELLLAKEIARAALYLQADNGGIRMAPLGTYYYLSGVSGLKSADDVAHVLDQANRRMSGGLQGAERRVGKLSFIEEHIWYYEEISTENNVSWYAAFRMLYEVTGDPQYAAAMTKIENYFRSVWDAADKSFAQGVHFMNGQWRVNKIFAADVQNWIIVVLGPGKIDEMFGPAAAWNVWNAARSKSGCFSAKGDLQGVGFTDENSRISIEWTGGAILAARILADYYQGTAPERAKDLLRDIFTMRRSLEDYRFSVKGDQAAYSYSSQRGWIPFGWFSQAPDVLSLAATAWIFFIDTGINPFFIPK